MPEKTKSKNSSKSPKKQKTDKPNKSKSEKPKAKQKPKPNETEKTEEEKSREEKKKEKSEKLKKYYLKEQAKLEREKEKRELEFLIQRNNKREQLKAEAKEKQKKITKFEKNIVPCKTVELDRAVQVDKLINRNNSESKKHNILLWDTVCHDMTMEVDEQGFRVNEENTKVLKQKYLNPEEIEVKVMEKLVPIEKLFNKVFQMFKPEEIILSFNGGKDCTVVMHLLEQYVKKNHPIKHLKIPTLYVDDPDAFIEVNDFINDCEKIFNIELIRKCGPINDALRALCEERPLIRAVFMGNRRTDPHCYDLNIMQPTDSNYPPLMRINPIIDWTCRDIWQYMYLFNVPYCILYQMGYTSIGNRKNTKPNPYLRILDSQTGRVIDYKPAHELLDNDALERAGRF